MTKIAQYLFIFIQNKAVKRILWDPGVISTCNSDIQIPSFLFLSISEAIQITTTIFGICAMFVYLQVDSPDPIIFWGLQSEITPINTPQKGGMNPPLQAGSPQLPRPTRTPRRIPRLSIEKGLALVIWLAVLLSKRSSRRDNEKKNNITI